MADRKNNLTETHPSFPSGDWIGFYLEDGQKQKMKCQLEFKNGNVTGNGSDSVGAFKWTGTYDLNSETCSMVKRYLGAHTVNYEGHADENGIWGKWRIFNYSEGFHLWPKGEGEEDEREEEDEKQSIFDMEEEWVLGQIPG